MASNPTPDSTAVLRALADRLADGCHDHEVSIGIKQNTETAIRAARNAVAGAELQTGLKEAAAAEAATSVTEKDEDGAKVLSDCRLRLAQKLGQRWSSAWAPTGFPGLSTAVPDSQNARFTLLENLKNYFTAMPAQESADMGATAALCEAAWTAISTARNAQATADSALTTAREAEEEAVATLRRRVRGLISELETLIADDDPRWELFGLNIPAHANSPEAVSAVELAALGGGRVEVTWPYAVRATRYRVQAMVVGVDEEFSNKASVKDLLAILKGYTAGQVVKVRIFAGNEGGEAGPSPEAQITVT